MFQKWWDNPKWWFNPTLEDDIAISTIYEPLLSNPNIIKTVVEQIILWDQIPRHIFRHQHANHIIQYFLQKALAVKIENLNILSIKEYIFAQLPKRHTNDPLLIHQVMFDTWEYISRNQISSINPDFKLLKKFIKATYQRCPMNQEMFLKLYEPNTKTINNKVRHKMIDLVKQQIDLPSNPIILSLSGGVDSMVLSYIMSILGMKFTAVMINYMNRDTCDDEEKLVRDWCHSKIGVPLYVRRITEIQREPCREMELREVYETYTRNVRFGCYKTVAPINPTVLMGHNMDDCFENILTNIVQRKKFDDLKGMSNDAIISGIRFIRPMLNVSKEDIFAFANEFDIPHLPDSTVSWCKRGQIRDTIRPMLHTWDANSIHAFFNISQTLSEMHGILDNLVKHWVNKMNKYENGCITTIQSLTELPKSALFWRHFLYELTNIQMSHKSINNLLQRLCEGKVNMNKNAQIHISRKKKSNEYKLEIKVYKK